LVKEGKMKMSQVQVLRWEAVNYPLLKSNVYELKYLYHTITRFMTQMKGDISLLERIRLELHIANVLEFMGMIIWGSFNPTKYEQLPSQLQEVTEEGIFNTYVSIGAELNPRYTSYMPSDLFLQLSTLNAMIQLLLPYNAYQEAWQEINMYLLKLRRLSDVMLSKVEYLMGLLKITPEEPFVPFW